MGQLEIQEEQEILDLKGHKVIKVSKDLKVQLVLLGPQVHLEIKEHRVKLEHLGSKEIQDRKDLLVTGDLLEAVDSLDPLEIQAYKDLLALLDL